MFTKSGKRISRPDTQRLMPVVLGIISDRHIFVQYLLYVTEKNEKISFTTVPASSSSSS